MSFYDLKPPPLNAGQGCDCFFFATHDTSETIWSSSWWRTATWTRRRTPTSSPRTLSGRHIIPFSIQEKSNKMNTLLDKQYCHCCPNKSLNKKSKSLFEIWFVTWVLNLIWDYESITLTWRRAGSCRGRRWCWSGLAGTCTWGRPWAAAPHSGSHPSCSSAADCCSWNSSCCCS